MQIYAYIHISHYHGKKQHVKFSSYSDTSQQATQIVHSRIRTGASRVLSPSLPSKAFLRALILLIHPGTIRFPLADLF